MESLPVFAVWLVRVRIRIREELRSQSNKTLAHITNPRQAQIANHKLGVLSSRQSVALDKNGGNLMVQADSALTLVMQISRFRSNIKRKNDDDN